MTQIVAKADCTPSTNKNSSGGAEENLIFKVAPGSYITRFVGLLSGFPLGLVQTSPFATFKVSFNVS